MMELRHFIASARKWAWLVLLFTILGGASAYIFSANTVPTYQASTTLLISLANNPTIILGYNDPATSDRLTKNYAEWLTKRPLVEEVIQKLKLPDTAETLARKITVRPIRDTQFLIVDVEDNNPAQATAVANELPKVLIDHNQQILSERFVASKDKLTKNLESLKQEIDATQTRLNSLRQQSSTTDQAEVARLQTVLTEQQNTYASLLKSYDDIRIAEIQSQDTILIIEPAVVPGKPVKPNKTLNILMGVVVGMMLAAGAAVLVEFLDDTLKTPQEVQKALGLAVVGVVRHWPSGNMSEQPIALAMPRSSIVEAYRTLRTNIKIPLSEKPLKSLLITSGSAAEGKSVTAANLAVVMAQSGYAVILVDADLRQSSQHRLFNLANHVGLTDALLDHANVDEIIQQTEVKFLRVVSSGRLPPNPTELLDSRRAKQVFNQLYEQADIVIFDSPPALPVADAAILASQVDGILFVIAAGRTRREAARDAQETLSVVGAHLVGAVLNLSRGPNEYYSWAGAEHAPTFSKTALSTPLSNGHDIEEKHDAFN